jgi:perosamine synthetase
VSSPPPIPLFEPLIEGNEWAYVKECLDTNWISSVGAYVSRFEEAAARRLGVKHAVATVNGTAALHVALMISGVEAGDEVVMPTITFVAPANAVRYVGARPVFMDAEPRTFQIDVPKTLEFLAKGCRWSKGVLRNKASGRRVRALMPVDVLGHPADVRPLIAAARKYGLAFIQDASESLGSRYRGAATGRTADVSCLSFNGNKLVTTGGGGMLLTDDPVKAARARHLTTQAKDDPVEYIHGEVGYNYRLTNVLAAIGLAQLERLDRTVAAKRRAAARYATAFAEVPGVEPMREAPWAKSTFWMYTVLIDAAKYGQDSRALLRRLAGQGIMTRPLWQPMHLSPAHAGSQAYRCETAARIYRDALSLPSSVGLTAAQQKRVVAAITARPA